MNEVNIIGGGFAGVEAAWQAASWGARVRLYEMRPVQQTPAHRTDKLGEIRHLRIAKAAVGAGRSRLADNHVPMRLRDIPPRFAVLRWARLFDKKHAPLPGKAAHQMLRPLINKIPS